MSKLFKSKLAFGLVVAFALVVATTVSAYTFTAPTLKMGSKSQAVMELQKVLNANGYTVSSTGAGSPGYESTYFGSKTKSAVMKWQAAVGLTADGVVGPASRAVLNGTTTTGGTTFPAGCSSSAGYSSTTGLPCSSGTSTVPGCMPGYMYSATTGQACSGSTTVVNNGPVGVMLSTDNPASSTLVTGQATADLAHFTFTGSGAVTKVVLQRLGVSADSTPSNVYLFDGAMRLTDAASVSSNGLVTFNNAAGLFTVSGSKTVAVKSDIALLTSGQTVGFKLVSFDTSAGTTTANLSGNIHTIASSTLASVSAGTVTPSGATLNPGAGVTVWQSTLNISTRDVMMKRISIRNVGSAPASAFGGFKLYVNGVQVGTASSLDANGYVNFDFMSNPVLLASGSRVVRLDADIVSGASRTVQFSLRQAADVDFVDSSFGVNITPTSTPWYSSSANTISGSTGGTMTVEKDSTSPSTNVTLGGNDITLGVFKLTAFGEAIKVETLSAGFTFTDGGTVNAAATLRNGRLLVSTDGTNWTQYGSTATLVPAGTSYTLNYTVNPGTPVWVKVNADVYDNDGTGSLDTSDTLLAKLMVGSSNAQKVDSLGSINVPTSTVSANTVSVASASLSLVKSANYANQTTTLPANNFKIGSWNLTGSSVEDVLLTTLSFDIRESTSTEFDEGDITNMYVVVKNGSTVVAQPSPIATLGTGADQNFSINYTLLKNANVTVELFANLADDGLDMVAGVSGGSDAIDSTDAFDTVLMVSGTSLVSGQSVTAGNGSTTVSGQAIAYGAASITASADASNPVASIVYDNQTVTTLAAKFAAVTAGYNVTDITVTVSDASAVSSVDLYDGATLVASRPGATTVTFNGLSWNVPANSNKVLTVKLVLGTVGIGAGTSGSAVTTAISAFTAVNTSTGVSAAGTVSSPNGNAIYVYAAVPTITNAALPTSILAAGTQALSRVTVATNGSGTVGWNRMVFNIVKTSAPTLASFTLWDVDSNTQVAGAAVVRDTANAASCGATLLGCRVSFVPTAEQQVSGAKTYELRATVGGTLVADDYVSTNINSNTTYVAPTTYLLVVPAGSDATYALLGSTASFVWSDVSATSHDTTTSDWNNDYLVKNIPTSSLTLTK